MVLPKDEKEIDPKLEQQKEERVSTIDLISRINCVPVGIKLPLSRLLLLLLLIFLIQKLFNAGDLVERR